MASALLSVLLVVRGIGDLFALQCVLGKCHQFHLLVFICPF